MIKPKFETQLAALFTALVSEFVSYPADLEITCTGRHPLMFINWRSRHRADTSRLIGKLAQTYQALQKLVKLIGKVHGWEADLERVGEPEHGSQERYMFVESKWAIAKDRVLALIARTAEMCVTRQPVTVEYEAIDAKHTTVNVGISNAESPWTVEAMAESLGYIFRVIGNMHGHKILITVNRTHEPESEQPATAAGRFSR
jgi:predicted RNA-binding protein YlqC (UPF0109 family)